MDGINNYVCEEHPTRRPTGWARSTRSKHAVQIQQGFGRGKRRLGKIDWDVCRHRGGQNRLRVGTVSLWLGSCFRRTDTYRRTSATCLRDHIASMSAFFFSELLSQTTWIQLTARYGETEPKHCPFAPWPAPHYENDKNEELDIRRQLVELLTTLSYCIGGSGFCKWMRSRPQPDPYS